MALANAEVVERFVLHQEGKGKHLRSDGETLWSYRTPIARWTPIGLVCDVSWYSMTTAIHQSLLWSRCRWDFYPWDDLRGDVPLEEMAKAEGVAVASKKAGPGHLFFRIAGGKCEYVYCSNHRLVEHLDQRRFLSELEASALLEYAKRRGWERRRIGEALLSGDRAKLLAALLLEENERARNLLPLLRQEVRPAPPRGQGLLDGCPGCPGEAGKTVLRQAPLPVDHREAQAPHGVETPENSMGEGQSAHAGIPPFGGTCPTGASATCR
jgi:hypothetical protein